CIACATPDAQDCAALCLELDGCLTRSDVDVPRPIRKARKKYGRVRGPKVWRAKDQHVQKRMPQGQRRVGLGLVDKARELVDGGKSPAGPTSNDGVVACTLGAQPTREQVWSALPNETGLPIQDGSTVEVREDDESRARSERLVPGWSCIVRPHSIRIGETGIESEQYCSHKSKSDHESVLHDVVSSSIGYAATCTKLRTSLRARILRLLQRRANSCSNTSWARVRTDSSGSTSA